MSAARSVYSGLARRVAVVTGGAGGIGARIVARLVDHGATVAYLDIDDEAASRLAEKLASGPGAAVFYRCDLTDVEALRATCGRVVAELGAPTILVNNAADDSRHDPAALDAAAFDRVLAINLRHQFFAIQALAEPMAAAGGGAIVNMGSHAAYLGAVEMPVYGLAKSGVFGLTRAFARRLGSDRIRVNQVVPGWVLTERQRRLWWTPEAEERRRTGQCIPDEIGEDDIAEFVLFLASDAGRMCTNQSYFIDGGRN